MLESWIERAIAEAAEVTQRLGNLDDFIANSAEYQGLTPEIQALVTEQRDCMGRYARILFLRVGDVIPISE